MIQFNLLPDVKINLIKAKKTNRLVIGISLLGVVICVLVMGIMFSLTAAQKQHLKDLNSDIIKYTSELNDTPDLTKILTIQNQLNSLPDLYAARPAITRLPGYLDQTTPTTVNLSSIAMDFTGGTTEISGSADSLESVNRYVDTLKFTTYTVGEDKDVKTEAFKGVVLGAFSKGAQQATFTIKMTFDPVIFDISQDISLVVPNTVTTRSQASAPSSLFKTTPTENQ